MLELKRGLDAKGHILLEMPSGTLMPYISDTFFISPRFFVGKKLFDELF
jgi:hypothetical protein